MAIENSDRDCSVRLEPERHGDHGEPVRRLPVGLAMRCREWSRALWAPVYLRLGLGVFTLGAIAMIGARAQGEPRGTVVAKLEASASAAPPAPPVSPVPCATPSAAAALPETSNGPSASPQGRAGSAIAEAPPAPRSSESGRIILNTATEADFDRLPGVGPKRAQEIVKLRERLGRFRRVSDLLRIRGVGPKTLKKWQDLVVLDPPPVEEPKAPDEKASRPGVTPKTPEPGSAKSAEPGEAKGSG